MPLIFQLNWGDRNWGDNPAVETLLNTAPPCGIWNYECQDSVEWLTGSCDCEDWNNTTGRAYSNAGLSGPFTLQHDWTGNNRLFDAEHRQGIGPICNREANDMGADCEFNGLDYMLLFNLYALERGGAGSPYLGGMMNSYYMENFNVAYPDHSGMGSYINRLKLNWLEYLSAIDVIASPSTGGESSAPGGWVDFRGAQVIDLKPSNIPGGGFWAQKGCVFMAHIKDYNCSGPDVGDGYYYFAELNPDAAHYLTGRSAPADTGWKPVAYYQPGYNARQLPIADMTPPDSTDYFNIANNPLQFITSHKDEIIQIMQTISQSPDLQNMYGINADSLAYYTNILSLDTVTDNTENVVNIMPNPTTGVSYLSYTLSAAAAITIRLTNNVGQDMSYLVAYYEPNEHAGTYKVMLQTDKVVPGMYYVTITINGQPVTKMVSVVN